MTKRVCIIPCGAKKIWDVNPEAGPTIAKDTYISPFGKACQNYATTFFDEWFILSAKHGFLLPGDKVENNYDVAFNTKNPEIISMEKLQKQVEEKGFQSFEEIVVLGGKKHHRIVEQLFPKEKLVYPLKGCKGIGYMLQKLKGAVEQKEEITSGKESFILMEK